MLAIMLHLLFSIYSWKYLTAAMNWKQVRLYGEPLGKAARVRQDKDAGKEGSFGNFKHLWPYVSCSFWDWIVSNRLEKSLTDVKQLVITPMQCIYHMLFLRVNFRILRNLDTVFGRLPCFWIYTCSVYNYPVDAQVQHLKSYWICAERCDATCTMVDSLLLCTRLSAHVHPSDTGTCCICVGWLNRWGIQDLLYFRCITCVFYNFFLKFLSLKLHT